MGEGAENYGTVLVIYRQNKNNAFTFIIIGICRENM